MAMPIIHAFDIHLKELESNILKVDMLLHEALELVHTSYGQYYALKRQWYNLRHQLDKGETI